MRTANEIFESLLLIETDECLIWTMSTKNGYPNGWVRGRILYLHAEALRRRTGERPPGAQALHSCGNRACLNYRHLRWGTQAENEADKVSHGRSNQGERHWKAKFTDEEVRRIRASIAPSKVLARKYGVQVGTIGRIRRGEGWRHLL